MRRHSETLKLGLSIVAGLVFIYGFYAYNELHHRYKKTEENNEKLQQLHESLSSQLQVVYEHKSRLEKTVQKEKLEYSKAREEWETDKSEMLAKYASEKSQLSGRIDSISKDLGMLKSRYEDLETDYSKLQDEHKKLIEDHKLLTDQHNDEYKQYKVDCENDIVKLKDQVADCKRQLNTCQNQVDTNMQNQLDSKRDAQSRKQRNDEHAENKNNENAIPNIAPIVPDAKEKIRQEPENKQDGYQAADDKPVAYDDKKTLFRRVAGKDHQIVKETNDGNEINIRHKEKDMDVANNMQVPGPRVDDDENVADHKKLRRAGVAKSNNDAFQEHPQDDFRKQIVDPPFVADNKINRHNAAEDDRQENDAKHGLINNDRLAIKDSVNVKRDLRPDSNRDIIDAPNKDFRQRNRPDNRNVNNDQDENRDVDDVNERNRDNIGHIGGAGNDGQLVDSRHQIGGQLNDDRLLPAPPPARQRDAENNDGADDDDGDVDDNGRIAPVQPIGNPANVEKNRRNFGKQDNDDGNDYNH